MDDNIVVLIEDTTLKLQRLLSTMVNDRIQRDVIGTQAKGIINGCITKLTEAECPREFIEKQRQAFMTTFLNWYIQITTNLAKLAQKTKNPTFYQSYTEIVGVEPKTSGKSMIISLGQNDLRAGEKNNSQNIEVGGIKNIRDYFTTGETGYSQMFIEDYQKRVNREIMKIASMNVVLVDRKGRTMSARNLAEMQVRYEEQVKDFDKLDKKGVKYVVATSHANASIRCSWWQGKIFELDAKVGDVKIVDNNIGKEPIPKGKTPDGKNCYSLKEAMEHGFLGYNCRHRLIEYKAGMIMPKNYSENQINKERNIEQTARNLERRIRTAKKRAMLANNSLDRKKYQEQSKMFQDTYWDYCKDHDYPVAEWRTRVAINEREGIKSGSINFAPTKERHLFYISKNTANDLIKESNLKLKKSTDIEPVLTGDLKQVIEKTSGYLEGLDFRLKSKESLQRKVLSEYSEVRFDLAEKKKQPNYDNSILETVNKMHDINRYTAILDINTFVDDYFKINNYLLENGYRQYKVKNTFKIKESSYKGLNNQYEKNGVIFELQFHTKESFDLKNGVMHKMYEEARLDTTPKERKEELNREMLAMSNKIKIPKNIDKI